MNTGNKFLICILMAALLASVLCVCASAGNGVAAPASDAAMCLPYTGGIGVPIFYVAGGGLILIAFVLLIIQLFRKR